MKTIKDIFNAIFGVVVAAIVIIITFFILIFVFIGEVFKYPARARQNNMYKEFLEGLEGEQFFCYNNRRATKAFIENEVLPLLDPRIKIIYLNGKMPVSEYELLGVKTMLYDIEDRKGFPYLLKVKNGKVYDESINNTTYIALQNPKQMELLLNKINVFFNIG